MNDTLSTFGQLHHALRVAFFGTQKKTERPEHDPQIPLEENIRLQLEWVTDGTVTLMTRGRDAFIFELRKPAGHIARIAIKGDANAQIVMDKEKDFSDWVRREFPNDLDRFALVENRFRIDLDGSNGRDVHVELKANNGNLSQNLEMISGFAPAFMAKAWLRILKPVALVYGKRKIVHGDIKPDNILVDLTPEGSYMFRIADWGGHYDPVAPRPPYEVTAMFLTKESLITGKIRPADDVRALQLTFLEMYAGLSLPGIIESCPEAFEPVPHNGKEVPILKQIPARIRRRIPASLLRILTSSFDNVSEPPARNDGDLSRCGARMLR